MNEEPSRTTLAHPTPELPVEDVQRAQQHYRDALGFEIGWLDPDGDIGAVSRDDIAVFFRKRRRPFEPAVHWVFAPDIDATYEELRARGARIVEPLAKKPWGLRQFTVEDIDGNRFYSTATEARAGGQACLTTAGSIAAGTACAPMRVARCRYPENAAQITFASFHTPTTNSTRHTTTTASTIASLIPGDTAPKPP